MELSVSPKGASNSRHLVLKLTFEEEFIARKMIIRYVLGPIHPVRERGPDGVTYRFAIQYMHKLMLALPEMEISDQIRRKLFKDEMRRQARLPMPNLDIDDLRATLRPYQRVGVGQLVLNMRRGFMLNDEMGLGKTIQVLAALLHTEAFPALVICPNNAKYNWEREINKFSDLSVAVVDGNAGQRDALIRSNADIVVANFAQIRVLRREEPATEENIGEKREVTYIPSNPAFFDVEWETLITDEFHNLSNPGAQQTQGYVRIKSSCFIGLSGTPVINEVEDIWPTLHKIEPERFPNPHQLSASLKVRVGNKMVVNPEVMGELKDWVQDHSLRRRKDQVEKDLPQAQYMRRDVIMTAEQRALYDEINDEFRLKLEDGSVKGVPSFFAQLTRLKQACLSPELYGGSTKSAKIDELKVIVEELVASGEKALVFSQWSTATRIFERELAQYSPAYIDGSVAARHRMEQVDRFNNDPECKLYIGTIGSNKESISLGEATYVIFTDKGWTPAEHEQAVGRSAAGGLRGLAKKGQKVTVIDLYAVDTVEERIEALLRRKSNMFRRFAESDGGTKVEKGVLKSLQEFFMDELSR